MKSGAQKLDSWIGRETHQSDRIAGRAVSRFLATVGTSDCDDENSAPLGFHWCTCLSSNANEDLGEDGHALLGTDLPPIDLPRRMWAASKVRFLREIPVGADIERMSRIKSIERKTGKSGDLVFLGIDHETLAGQRVAISENQTIVYCDTLRQVPEYPVARSVPLADWQSTRLIETTSTLLFRYSALTFNSHRVHYDLPYARDIEKYPDLVVHGPLTATLLLRFAAEKCSVRSNFSFSFRAVAPAYVGETLQLLLRRTGDECELAAVGIDGRTVVEGKLVTS